ncbi:hypothetical protein BT96DRAFT_972002 [Gymnopus androsaceus JB14]|uniref:Uncharacterized protein n=1 Tax=Gymnopus androsaceus JB14 TaxID=1447944 RepID=A0A6A4IA80_9AGAR|nr:hypothetical protein BT96DRAFT_972002 [Gymnopus androsaceus JB14]
MSGKKRVNVLFLSVDDDANITTTAASPVPLELDMGIVTASMTLKKALGTERSTFVFFCLNPPILRSTSTTMKQRLGDRFNYDWKQWFKGQLQTVIDYDPDPDNDVHLVAVFMTPRDAFELPGGKFFSAQTSEPSNPLIKVRFAKKISDELCAIYEDEEQRGADFRELLGEFLEAEILKVQIGDYTTDGAVKYELAGKDGAARLLIKVKAEQCGKDDPTFQVSLFYVENARLVRNHASVGANPKAAAWMRLRLPSILITRRIQIFGGVMVDRPQTEVLTASVPMYFHASNEDMFLDLARTLTALSILFADLGKLHENPLSTNPSPLVQHYFPYPRSFKQGDETILFRYIERVDAIRLVFKVITQVNHVLYVKYARQYGEAAHRKAHELEIAPKLLVCDDLEGGWKMIIMEPIPEAYEAVDDIFGQDSEEVQDIVRRALEPFFEAGYVHGDLRPANIFVDVEEKKVLVIDYDWARYIWRPEGELSLRPIQLEHDRRMVEHL